MWCCLMRWRRADNVANAEYEIGVVTHIGHVTEKKKKEKKTWEKKRWRIRQCSKWVYGWTRTKIFMCEFSERKIHRENSKVLLSCDSHNFYSFFFALVLNFSIFTRVESRKDRIDHSINRNWWEWIEFRWQIQIKFYRKIGVISSKSIFVLKFRIFVFLFSSIRKIFARLVTEHTESHIIV